MTTWFTSDHHFGHANIIDYCDRPFTNVGSMNATMWYNWNNLIQPEDTVYIVGDLAMGTLEASLAWVEQLNGHKKLVPGNHDKCWKGKVGWEKWVAAYEAVGLSILADRVTVEIGGEQVLVCHFPYYGDSTNHDRYAAHRPDDEGGWLIHGHVHDVWKFRNRMINVGVDAWHFRPVSAERIEAHMRHWS